MHRLLPPGTVNYRFLVILAVVVACSCLGGCEDDPVIPDSGQDPGPQLTLPLAGSENQLLANFKTAYESIDYAGYLEVVDPGFLVYLKQSAIDQNNLPTDHFDYAQDCEITGNMFSGEPPSDQVLGINRIEFTTFVGSNDWVDSEDSRFPGARTRVYDVNFRFEQGSGTTRRDVTLSGQIEFHVVAGTILYEGARRTRFTMIGQVDDTVDKSADPWAKPNEDVSWSMLKVIFRSPEE